MKNDRSPINRLLVARGSTDNTLASIYAFNNNKNSIQLWKNSSNNVKNEDAIDSVDAHEEEATSTHEVEQKMRLSLMLFVSFPTVQHTLHSME